MPLRLNVGISKKIGQPDYGSLGASCNVEIELDASLLFEDPEAFQERAMNVHAACRQAVEEELSRQHCSGPQESADDPLAGRIANRPANGSPNAHHGHRASQKQLDYAGQLAGQIRGMGARRLESLAEKMFAKPLAGLSCLEASGLIDALKEMKVGKIDVKTVLNRAAA